jgi:hypothetical protein
VTAWLLAQMLGVNKNAAKIGCMALSYVAWVAFTWALFAWVLKPDVYLIPAMGTMTALVSSFVYLIAWVVLPTWKAKTNG